ncbi:hypothetical protein JOC55_006176 [Paenibacillus sacheonensis]|nr:hypothetical protein [Paenibacillus sacheonensis]
MKDKGLPHGSSFCFQCIICFSLSVIGSLPGWYPSTACYFTGFASCSESSYALNPVVGELTIANLPYRDPGELNRAIVGRGTEYVLVEPRDCPLLSL